MSLQVICYQDFDGAIICPNERGSNRLDLKKSYFEDIRLFKNTSSRVAFVVLVCLLAIFPVAALYIQGGSYYTNVLNLIAIHAIVAIGLNILIGCTGQVSLGHAGFFAIGAYVQGLLITNWGVPILPSLMVAGLLAALFGLLLGLPSLRLEGPYLAIATLGFGLAVTQIIGRMEIFGGRMGLVIPPTGFILWVKSFISQHVSAERAVDAPQYAMYVIIMPLLVLLTIMAHNIMKTRMGRAFFAIRDSDIAAEATGINLTVFKTSAFAISAFYAGIAGGLYSHTLGFINPESFDLRLSIMFLAMVVIGGLGSILGSHLGAILMTLLPLALTSVRNVPEIILGAILILIILFEPLGLRGRWLKIKSYWKAWPF